MTLIKTMCDTLHSSSLPEHHHRHPPTTPICPSIQSQPKRTPTQPNNIIIMNTNYTAMEQVKVVWEDVNGGC